MDEPAFTWIEGSEERRETRMGWTVRVRAHTVGMPALLIVECLRSHNTAPEELIRLRRAYWQYGPIGRVRKVDPLDVSGGLYYRTFFEIDSPRRSTVVALAGDIEKGLRLVVRLVVAGFGRVERHLDDLCHASIGKALEVVEGSQNGPNPTGRI